MPKHNFIDRTGTKVGMLAVIARAENDTFGNSYWHCRCDCGNTMQVRGTKLAERSKNRFRLSCGRCHYPELYPKEYAAWSSMKARCSNKDLPNYKNYGGRGITVSDNWKESFDNFLADMGTAPDDHYTLERIENDLGYSKENCKWSTRQEQAYNKRDSIKNSRGRVKTNISSTKMAELKAKLQQKKVGG